MNETIDLKNEGTDGGRLKLVVSLILFFIAGLAEIGGGYLIWLWLREGRSIHMGVTGGILLALYGIIATLQTFPSFGKVYAAYGGSVSFNLVLC